MRYDPSSYGVPSSGDEATDQQAIRDFIRHQALMDEGMCPNGCGPRVPWDEDASASVCPACGFWCNTPVIS